MATVEMSTLRPLGIGELLDQAIRLYRKNFLSFIGIIAVVQVPLSLFQLFFSLALVQQSIGAATASVEYADYLLPTLLSGGGNILVAILAFILVQGIGTAAMTRAIADNRLGLSTGVIDAYSRIGSSWKRLLGALLFLALINIGLGIWILIPCLGLISPGILAFTILVITPLIAPIVVIENKSAAQSLRRAWDLARRRFWWVMGFIFVLTLIGQLIVTGPTLVIGSALTVLLEGAFDSGQEMILQTIGQSLSGIVLTLIYMPLQLTAITLMYFDLRVRTEGLDMALQTQDEAGGLAAVITHQAPPAESGNLATKKEIVYFFVLGFAIIALYALIMIVLMGFIMAATSGISQGGF